MIVRALLLCLVAGAMPGLVSAQPASRPAMIDDGMLPKLITLNLHQKTPQEMLERLTEQTGVRIRANPANLWQSRPATKADLSLKDVSFFRALREICGLGGLQVSGVDRDLMVMAGGGRFGLLGDGPISDNGGLMVIGQRIHRAHTADLQTGEIRRNCAFSLTLFIDPRLRVVAWKPMVVSEARDDQGRNIIGPTYASPAVERYTEAIAWQINQTVSLTPATRTGGVIAKFKGYLPAVLALRTTSITIDDPLTRKQHKQEAAPFTVELLEMKDQRPNQTPKTYQVDLALHCRDKTDLPAFELGRLVQLVDAKGVPLMRQRFQATKTAWADGRAQVTLIFNQQTNLGEQIGPPTKLIVEVPVELREVGLPFEFRELALP